MLVDLTLVAERPRVAQVGARCTVELRQHKGQDLAVDVRPGHLVLEVELDLQGVADVAELHRLGAGLPERALVHMGRRERLQTVAEGAAGDAQHVVDGLVTVFDRASSPHVESDLPDGQIVRDVLLLTGHK